MNGKGARTKARPILKAAIPAKRTGKDFENNKSFAVVEGTNGLAPPGGLTPGATGAYKGRLD
jgi:hypothetical protein